MAETASGGLVDSLVQFVTEFVDLAANVDPISLVLLVVGAVLTVGSALFFGYLSVRGVLSAIAHAIPGPSGPTGHQRRGHE